MLRRSDGRSGAAGVLGVVKRKQQFVVLVLRFGNGPTSTLACSYASLDLERVRFARLRLPYPFVSFGKGGVFQWQKEP